MTDNNETTTRFYGTEKEQNTFLYTAASFDPHLKAETHYVFSGLSDFRRKFPEAIVIRITFTECLYTESGFKEFFMCLAEHAPHARFDAETDVHSGQFNLRATALLDHGILRVYCSYTDLNEAENEFREDFMNTFSFTQFWDIFKTDSYIPDSEDYESLIRYSMKEKPDLSLMEFGFSEFSDAFGGRLSDNAIAKALPSICFRMDSFNHFCERKSFHTGCDLYYDPLRKIELPAYNRR